jgi:hypothetical protein
MTSQALVRYAIMWPMEAVFTEEKRGWSTIDNEMQSSRRALLYCFSTLKNDLVVLVSRRDTVKAELARFLRSV